jgi:hypothetical protein
MTILWVLVKNHPNGSPSASNTYNRTQPASHYLAIFPTWILVDAFLGIFASAIPGAH